MTGLPELPEIIASLEIQVSYERARMDKLIRRPPQEPAVHRKQRRRLDAAERALSAAKAYAACFGALAEASR